MKAGYKYPFLDPSLSWATRIDDLVSRLTLDEIVQQTMTFYTDPGTVGVPRLGIKPYPWITECLRGQVDTNGTAFPQALGLSSAFRYIFVLYMVLRVSARKEFMGGTPARRRRALSGGSGRGPSPRNFLFQDPWRCVFRASESVNPD